MTDFNKNWTLELEETTGKTTVILKQKDAEHSLIIAYNKTEKGNELTVFQKVGTSKPEKIIATQTAKFPDSGNRLEDVKKHIVPTAMRVLAIRVNAAILTVRQHLAKLQKLETATRL